jgi:hypothetical protein
MPAATADITKLGYRFSTDIKSILVIKASSTLTSALMMPCGRSPVVANGNVVDKRGHLIDGRRRRPPVPATPGRDLLNRGPEGARRAASGRCASSLIRWRAAPRGERPSWKRRPSRGPD